MLKQIVLSLPFQSTRNLRALLRSVEPAHPRTCPICDYRGDFGHAGAPPRRDALCRRCGSLERHRLLWLWLDQNRNQVGEPFLHFAPEGIFVERFRRMFPGYKTADLNDRPGTDVKLNIERIDLEDESVQTVMCNHVLEHVDDRRALRELHRILKPGGIAVISVPIIEGWQTTYEDESITSEAMRDLHFGQCDHVRFYGRDFRDRLTEAGFGYDEFCASGPDTVTYGLRRGESIFICRK